MRRVALLLIFLLVLARGASASMVGKPTECVGGTSATCSPPTGALNGSVEVMQCSALNTTGSFTFPGGWTTAAAVSSCTGLSSQVATHTYSTSDTTYTVSFSVGVNVRCQLMDVAGASTASPVDAIGSTCTNASSGNAPTQTPSVANEDYLTFGSTTSGSGITQPSNVIAGVGNGTGPLGGWSIGVTPGAGATGTTAYTSGASAQWNNTTIIAKQGATAYVGFRGYNAQETATFNNVTGHQSSDAVVIQGTCATAAPPTPPAACTQRRSDIIGSTDSFIFTCTDAASYVFTGTCSANFNRTALFRLSNAKVVPNITGGGSAGTGTTANAPSVTTTTPNNVVIASLNQQTGAVITPPDVQIYSRGANGDAANYLFQATAGATGTQTFSNGQNGSTWNAAVVAIEPTTAAPSAGGPDAIEVWRARGGY
jgi:hypothetical protein